MVDTMTDTNFEVKQGADWNGKVILKDDNGTVINLTGYTAKMQLRLYKDKKSNLFDTLSTDNSRITITPTAGQLDFKIPSSVSDNYTFDKAYYDLEITDSTGIITRVLEGIITINKNVTN